MEIQVTTFTNWGGLERRTYKIRKDFPHKILDMQARTILSYNCGVNF